MEMPFISYFLHPRLLKRSINGAYKMYQEPYHALDNHINYIIDSHPSILAI